MDWSFGKFNNHIYCFKRKTKLIRAKPEERISIRCNKMKSKACKIQVSGVFSVVDEDGKSNAVKLGILVV